MENGIEFVQNNWGTISLVLGGIYTLASRLWPTEKNWDFISKVLRLLDMVVPNLKRDKRDGSITQHCVILLLFLLPFISNGQNNGYVKGLYSFNVSDTAKQHTDRLTTQTLYGNAGNLYFDKGRNKWRVWAGTCPTCTVDSAYVDLLNPGGGIPTGTFWNYTIPTTQTWTSNQNYDMNGKNASFLHGNWYFGPIGTTRTLNTKFEIRGIGTGTNNLLKLSDSLGVSRLTILNNGEVTFTGTNFNLNSGNMTLSIPGGSQVAKFNGSGLPTLQLGLNPNGLTPISNNGSSSTLNSDGFGIAYKTSGGTLGTSNTLHSFLYSGSSINGWNATYKLLRLRQDTSSPIQPSTGNGGWMNLDISPTYNVTGTATGLIYGINYNPTETSMTGITHYGLIINSPTALSSIGKSTPSTNTRLDITGVSTGSILRLANNSDAVKWNFLNDGSLQIGGSSGSSGQAIISNGAGVAPTWQTISTSPAGSNTQIQFNNSGAFGASASFLFDSGTETVQIGNGTADGSLWIGSSSANSWLGDQINLNNGAGASLQINGSGTNNIIRAGADLTIIGSSGATGSSAFNTNLKGANGISNTVAVTGGNVNLTAGTVTGTASASGTGGAINLAVQTPSGGTPGTINITGGKTFFDGSINTTAGDAATIDGTVGRFRKDTTGSTFTLTNNRITANSFVMLQIVTTGLTAGYIVVPVAGAGSCTITFQTAGTAAAPSANADVNFYVFN